jgi:arylsulfatase A-like enzyme
MLTSLHPHQHGSSRNALRLRSGLTSLTTPLRRRGYRSAAFVGNWTLRDEITGLAEHFDHFQEIFTRKRWLVIRGEADAADITRETLKWVGEHTAKEQKFPFLVWAHYVEPHAPYRLHKAHLKDLGLRGKELSSSDRYDTEIAFVDQAVGDLLAGLAKVSPVNDTLVVFLSDHGESLGEHGYWGHGRNLYEETLHVPMGIAWQGKIEAQVVSAPASSLDLAPTILSLLGLGVPESFEGYDWSMVLQSKSQAPEGRITYHQAHRGAALGDGGNARRRGLLEVGLLHLGRKETLRLKGDTLRIVDLLKDSKERRNLAESEQEASSELAEWLKVVREGLESADELPAPVINNEDREKLKALGYID